LIESKTLLISDFYNHLLGSDHDPFMHDQKTMAKYIVAKFGEPGGYMFYYRDSNTLDKRPRGGLSAFSGAKVWRFECSQSGPLQNSKVSTLPYSKTRNRRGRLEVVDCQGGINVTFPSESSSVTFDVAVDLNHPPHSGRGEQFGLPVKIRQWIKDNPHSTVTAQREDLERALKNGEIDGLKDEWYNPASIHYWWRKEVGQKRYPSKDPWENSEYILKEHPIVCV
jgi:hypothetical protein